MARTPRKTHEPVTEFAVSNDGHISKEMAP